MLRLTLIRHAKAESARAGEEDWDRPLEARGRSDAQHMALRLKQRHAKPDKMLSSPAVRAIATATIVARELGIATAKLVQDERLYLASAKEMLNAVRELGGRARHLVVVGHNPGITEFADRLSGEREVDNLPTCAVYSLQLAIAQWSEIEWSSGVEAELDYPKKSE